MALESATYINQLVTSNPSGADPKGQGDDHLRLIKAVLLNTFPQLTGPVTATQAQMNLLTDATNFFKRGMIMMWGGTIPNIPAGWALCNGDNQTPDLRDRFIVGSGGNYGVGATGGALTHTHSASTDNRQVTTTVSCDGWGSNGPLGPNNKMPAGRLVTASTGQFPQDETIENISFSVQNQTFTSSAHAHAVTVNAQSNLPPYFALAYIMKL